MMPISGTRYFFESLELIKRKTKCVDFVLLRSDFLLFSCTFKTIPFGLTGSEVFNCRI